MNNARRKDAMNLFWTPYELRRTVSALVTPVIVILLFAGFGLLMRFNGVSPERSMRAVVAGLEIGVGTAAGLSAASLFSSDSLLELQLSLPTPYRTTIARRLGLLVAWSSAIGIVATIVAWSFGHPLAPVSFIEGQLVWFSPLVWFAGAGAILSLVLRSRAGSSAVIAGIWIFENLMGKRLGYHAWLRPVFLFATSYVPGASYWLGNRLELAATGLVLTLIVLVWLTRNPSTLLGAEA
jgi:hypothetical protein